MPSRLMLKLIGALVAAGSAFTLSVGLAGAEETGPPLVESGTAKSICQTIVDAGYSPHDYVLQVGVWWYWPGYSGPDGARMSKIWGSVEECKADAGAQEGDKVKTSENAPLRFTPQPTLAPQTGGGAEVSVPTNNDGNDDGNEDVILEREAEAPIIVSKMPNGGSGYAAQNGNSNSQTCVPTSHRVCPTNDKSNPARSKVWGDPNNKPSEPGTYTWLTRLVQTGPNTYEWQEGWLKDGECEGKK